MKNQLFSIGHGSRSGEAFIALLKNYHINYLIDVRSFPYSKFHTQFRRHELDYALKLHAIHYVFMGHLLGGRPPDPSCYTNGKVDHGILRTKDFFLQGISRLKKAYAAEASVAIMCSESKPGECHRHHLIGKFLAQQEILLTHIDEKGEAALFHV
jgi:uncharacterized protein (DUF488 family)